MNIIVESFGAFANKTQKSLSLTNGEQLDFDYLDEKIIINVDSVDNQFYNVSLNRDFCLEVNGKINLMDARKSFIFPKYFESVIALPLYDGSYKLKFSSVKEND